MVAPGLQRLHVVAVSPELKEYGGLGCDSVVDGSLSLILSLTDALLVTLMRTLLIRASTRVYFINAVSLRSNSRASLTLPSKVSIDTA